jgi:hypothetical protein
LPVELVEVLQSLTEELEFPAIEILFVGNLMLMTPSKVLDLSIQELLAENWVLCCELGSIEAFHWTIW